MIKNENELPKEVIIGNLTLRFKREVWDSMILLVPKGIVRFKDKSGFGWYARMQRNGEILINDKTYDNQDSIEVSLARAQRKYIASIDKLASKGNKFTRPRIKKTVYTALEGVCVAWGSYTHAGKHTPSHYLNIIVKYRPGPLGTKNKIKAFSCGTNNTLNKTRFEEKLKLAYAYRQYYNDLCLLGREGELADGFPHDDYLLNRIKEKKFKPINYKEMVKQFLSSIDTQKN